MRSRSAAERKRTSIGKVHRQGSTSPIAGAHSNRHSPGLGHRLPNTTILGYAGGGPCMLKLFRFPVFLALGLMLAGCNKTPPPPTRQAGEPSMGLHVGQRAPEIEGRDLAGVPFKLSDYRGKVVLLDFWKFD